MNDSSTLNVYHLTDKEKDILGALAQGLNHKEIATQSGGRPGTVRSHIDKIRLKLRAKNIPHAVAIGYETGILNGDVHHA